MGVGADRDLAGVRVLCSVARGREAVVGVPLFLAD